MDKSQILNAFRAYTESTQEVAFTPVKSSIKEVSNKFMLEAVSQSKTNAFRLDIGKLVLDKCHSKVSVSRHARKFLVEFLYPNANDKITIKVTTDGVDGIIEQVGLEDEEYTKNFSVYIISLIDKLNEQANSQSIKVNDNSIDGLVFDQTEEVSTGPAMATSLTGNPNLWESNSLESFNHLVAMVEADDESEGSDDAFNDLSDDFSEDLNAGDINDDDDFSADDFSADGGDFDLGDMSLGGGPGSGSLSDMDSVNDGASGVQAEDYVQFKDKTDWTNESLRNMQKLVAAAASQEMKKGEGVILTSDEVLNGTSGMVGDSNYEIIEKFLKVYPEIDGIDIPVELMDQIEDKLEMGDDQFDSWLQSKMNDITGTEEVNDVLNNDMFNDDFQEMGGEVAPEESESSFKDDGSFQSFIDKLEEDDEADSIATREAEIEVGGREINEFPNIG